MYGRALRCIRDVLWCLLAGLLFVTAFPAWVAASTAPVTPAVTEGIDVMLLIDTSGSMRYSDSRRVALESAKMFVDMLETNSSRIGVIGFSDRLQGVIPLTPIHNPDDKAYIKDTISGFIYNGYTDIGLALTEAVASMQTNTQAANRPMIVLMTDGFIQINTRKTGRTVEQSHQDVLDALDRLGGQVPVYTIGLDSEENVDTALLAAISDATSARTYIAREATELPQIYNEIMAEHQQSVLMEAAAFTADGKNVTPVSISVTSPYVTAATIILHSSRNLTEVTLQNPGGEVVPFDGVRCTLDASKQYSIIKIAAPEEGEWLVDVKGANNDRIKINLMYTYNMDISLTLSQEGITGPLFDLSRPVSIHARFAAANKEVREDALYAGMEAYLRVYDPDMNLIDNLPMTYVEDGLTTQYRPQTQGDLFLAVRAGNEDFSKDSPLYPLRIEIIPDTTALADDDTPDGTTSAGTAADESSSPAPEILDGTGLISQPASEQPFQAEPQTGSTPGVWRVVGFILAGLFTAALLSTGVRLAAVQLRKPSVPSELKGYLAVRAMTQDGVYTTLETPDLGDCAAPVALDDFLSTHLSGSGAKILLVPVDLDGITLTPSPKNNLSEITLLNKGDCEISDDEDTILTQRKITWPEGKRLTFTDPHSETFAKIEITFERSERHG